MNDNKDQKDKSISLINNLVVPILIALIAGGTSPWWINLFRGNGEVRESTTFKKREDAEVSQVPREFRNDNPLETQGANNDANSVNTRSSGNQTTVNRSDYAVQGVGNNVVQGTGNQLTIQQESDARSHGEFEIPTISGLSYHEARKILVKEGWIPFTQRHFYPQEESSLQHGTGKVFWDLGYWEIVVCSGTAEGFCRFEFSDPSGRRLIIVTAGMEVPSRSVHAVVNRVFFDKENLP